MNMVRMLKARGVEIYFEKENIYTFDAKGELLITIMASLAQEESRSLSENVSWGKRAKFAEGRFSLPYGRFLGFTKGEDGMPTIVEDEAAIVRSIYAMYIDGLSSSLIANELTARGILSPGGKAKWSTSTVDSILVNEKYKGDAILQKSFTLDFLQGHRKTNDGELPQYHFTGTHDAIIEPDVFDHVQRERERRRALGRSYSGKDIFSCRITCGDCGGLYGGKVWSSNTKYRRMIWRCNKKYEKGDAGTSQCTTPNLSEAEVKAAFVTVFNRLIAKRDEVIPACREVIAVVLDTTPLEREYERHIQRLQELDTLLRAHIKLNATEAQNQAEYARQYEILSTQFEDVQGKLNRVEQRIGDREARRGAIALYLDTLEQSGAVITEFSRRLWNLTVDTLTIYEDRRLAFRFKDGQEFTWQ